MTAWRVFCLGCVTLVVTARLTLPPAAFLILWALTCINIGLGLSYIDRHSNG